MRTQPLPSCATLCDPMDCSPPKLLCSWGFSRQEHWSGLPCPPPGGLPNPGIELTSFMSPALAGGCLFVCFLPLWLSPNAEFQALGSLRVPHWSPCSRALGLSEPSYSWEPSLVLRLCHPRPHSQPHHTCTTVARRCFASITHLMSGTRAKSCSQSCNPGNNREVGESVKRKKNFLPGSKDSCLTMTK